MRRMKSPIPSDAQHHCYTTTSIRPARSLFPGERERASGPSHRRTGRQCHRSTANRSAELECQSLSRAVLLLQTDRNQRNKSVESRECIVLVHGCSSIHHSVVVQFLGTALRSTTSITYSYHITKAAHGLPAAATSLLGPGLLAAAAAAVVVRDRRR